MEHRLVFNPRIAGVVLDGYLRSDVRPNQPEQGRPAQLTAREREVAQLLAEGRSNKEVATILGISVKTAETHRSRIMAKLGLRSITELVHWACRNGLVQP